jgi:hypothetical protein
VLTLPSFFTPLEAAVVEVILTNPNIDSEKLRRQVATSELKSRERNGYGFYTNFAVPETIEHYPSANEQFHATALVDGQLCGFILFIRDGRVAFLEGYPLGGDAWPQQETFHSVRLG